MDIRTSQVLAALDPLAVDLLLNLLSSPASEMGLIEATPGATQPTVHRKLRRLAEAGIISQAEDASGRGQPWRISTPTELKVLLQALFDLVDALDDQNRKERAAARQRLGVGRQRRLRLVD